MAFVQSSTCFVAIPKDRSFEGVRRVVTEALHEFDVRDVDESQPGGSSVSNISEILERVDFVIADVTVASNVLYLLGVADGLRKPILIMTQNRVPLPGDLAHRQLLSYDPGEVSKLRDFLRYWIQDAISLQLKRNASIR
jgi:hypothetical protein